MLTAHDVNRSSLGKEGAAKLKRFMFGTGCFVGIRGAKQVVNIALERPWSHSHVPRTKVRSRRKQTKKSIRPNPNIHSRGRPVQVALG